MGFLIAKCLVEGTSSYLLYPLFLRFRRGKIRYFVAAAILWTIASLTNCVINMRADGLWNGMDLSRVIKIAGISIFLYLGGLAVYGGIVKMLAALLLMDISMALVSLITGGITALITGNTIQYVMSHMELAYHPANTVAGVIILFLLFYLIKPLLNKFRDSFFEQTWISRGLFVVIYFFYLSPLVLNPGTYISYKNSIWSPVVASMVMTALLLLLLYHFYLEMLRHDNQMLQLSIQYRQEQMNQMKEQILLVRRFRHDIRRHLNLLGWAEDKNLTKGQQIQRNEYRKQLQQYYDRLSLGDYCDHPEINAVISRLDQACRTRGIPAEIRLKDVDFSSLEQPMEVLFYTVFWAIQYISMMNAETSEIKVFLHGGNQLGNNQLKLEITALNGSLHNKEAVSLDQEYLGYIRNCLKDRETAEIKVGENNRAVIIRWEAGWKHA